MRGGMSKPSVSVSIELTTDFEGDHQLDNTIQTGGQEEPDMSSWHGFLEQVKCQVVGG